MAKKAKPGVTLIGPYRKDSPLAVKGFVRSYIDSLETTGEQDTVELEPASAYLEVKAAPEDWKALQRFLFDDPGAFCQALLEGFIEPAVEYIEEKEGILPRGKHKHTHKLVQTLKRESAWLYVFFQFWCERPEGEFPEYLKQLIAIAKREDCGPDIMKGSTATGQAIHSREEYSAQGLTEYCINKVHGKDISEAGLFPFEDPFNFYETYIQGSIETIQKTFIPHDADPQRITSLVRKIGPLQDIFQALRLL